MDCESKWQSCSCFTKEIPDSDGLEESHLLMFQNNEGKSPQPPFIKGGNVVATLGKGGGTNVPMGLRKFTLTRIAKFTKFIKQFNPLTKREGKELGYTKFDSGTYTVLTPHPGPLPQGARENQASLSKGGGTNVPEGLRKFTLTRIAKFTKFIKQFNPLTKREGKELGYTKFDSGTYTVLTPHPGPLPQGARENQASLVREVARKCRRVYALRKRQRLRLPKFS